jgi:hypothetical protein
MHRLPENRSSSSAARGTTAETVLSSAGCYDENRPGPHPAAHVPRGSQSRCKDDVSAISPIGREIGRDMPCRRAGSNNGWRPGDILVDAILGTGLSSPVTGLYRDAIEAINRLGRPTVAVDLPSGPACRYGAVLGAAVRADLTVTLGLPKAGLYSGSGIDCAGTVRLVDIGIPASFVEAIGSRLMLLTDTAARAALPPRRPSAHKGTYGHLGVIAGSVGKTGAAAMAALSALRIGTGLVTAAIPRAPMIFWKQNSSK